MMEVGRWGEFLTVSRSPTETGTYSALDASWPAKSARVS